MLSVPLDGFCLNDLASVLGATPNHIPLKYSCVIKLVRKKLEKVKKRIIRTKKDRDTSQPESKVAFYHLLIQR